MRKIYVDRLPCNVNIPVIAMSNQMPTSIPCFRLRGIVKYMTNLDVWIGCYENRKYNQYIKSECNIRSVRTIRHSRHTSQNSCWLCRVGYIATRYKNTLQHNTCIKTPRNAERWSLIIKSRWNVSVLSGYLLYLSGKLISRAEGRARGALLIIIALWGWFCRDVLPVTCCEHGPPSITTVPFSKFSIAANILFN